MGTERVRVFVLAGLVVALLVVTYRALTVTSVADPAATTTPARSQAPKAARAAAQAPTAPNVHLGALDEERPTPVTADRNLFRFKEKAAPPPPPPSRAPILAAPAPVVPSGPPPPPPIPLKFIGIVEATGRSTRLAALVDATGRPYHGAEGDIVAGQYRILKIGVESIELSYLDGRGRQTIRLSGS
jgi:hypothetical protein